MIKLASLKENKFVIPADAGIQVSNILFKNKFKDWIPAFAGMTSIKLGVVLLSAIFVAGCAGSKTHLKVGKTDEGEVVEAEGLAPDDTKDVLLVKRASLADAQRNAVEKAVGVIVSARTFVEKAIAIENNILARTDGYIKKYDIIKEWREGGFYKTKIRALVALKDLEADLKEHSLLKGPELERPRVFVDIVEAIETKATEENAARTAFEKAMSDQGYVIASTSSAGAADVTVSGKATSYPFQTEKLGGFVSYRARLSIQAKRAGKSEVMVSLTKEASGLGGNKELAALKSLETVGELSANELGTQLAGKLGKGQGLLVMVEGVKSFADVESVRKHLAAQPSISDLTLRLYDEEMAQFDVILSAAKFSDLAARLDASQSLPLKVLESSPHGLRLKLN